jgi:hypothetical protein
MNIFYNTVLYWLYYYNYVVNGIFEFYHEFVDRLTIPPPPAVVYKVLRVPNEIEENAEKESNQKEIEENAEHKEPETHQLVDAIDCTRDYHRGIKIVPDDHYRVEYRLTWRRHRKYRVVCLDASDPSPCHDMFAGVSPDPKQRIVMAVLHNPKENLNENVIERVLKFAGPKNDFFGNKRLCMGHLFANDDLLPDTMLHMLYTDGRLLKYLPNDPLLI